MRWTDLDVSTGWWALPGEFAKNVTTSRVALNRLAVRLLRELHGLNVARHMAVNEGRVGAGDRAVTAAAKANTIARNLIRPSISGFGLQTSYSSLSASVGSRREARSAGR